MNGRASSDFIDGVSDERRSARLPVETPDRVPPDGTRRSALDATGAQTGDVHASGNAGRDVTHIGADPDRVFDLVRYLWEDRQDREIRRERLDSALGDMRDQIELYRITLAQRITAVADGVDRLAAIQADEARRVRQWLTIISMVLGFLVLVLAILVWREWAALAMRSMWDVAISARIPDAR